MKSGMHECAYVAHKWAGLSIFAPLSPNMRGYEVWHARVCICGAQMGRAIGFCTFVVDAEWFASSA